tara:strand:- start:1288 stop:1782 length:495 start_codon:yes stop_codon:yes gene_type:complete
MANPKYGGFSYMGVGMVVTTLPVSIDATPAAADLVRVRVPASCYIQSIEIQVDNINGGATSLKTAVYRDAAGDEACIGNGPSGATQTITTGLTTATDGAVIYTVERDITPLYANAAGSSVVGSVTSAAGVGSSLPSNTRQSLYVSVGTNAGTCRITRMVINWRA